MSPSSIRFLIAACSVGCDTSPVEVARLPIVGGVPAGDRFPAVARLALDLGAYGTLDYCGGTLIAPSIVLTAAHCVHAGVVGYDSREALTAALRVYFDSGPAAVDRVVAHPEFKSAPVSSGIDEFSHDLGLVYLASPATALPMPINRADLTPFRGNTMTQVGVGATEFHGFDASGFPRVDGLGEKRFIELPIADLTADDIIYGDASRNTCFADSGGPSLLVIDGVETIIGVSSSFVSDPLCHGLTSSQRTDAELAFLDAAIGAPVIGEPPIGEPAVGESADEGCASSPRGSAGLAVSVLLASLVARKRVRG